MTTIPIQVTDELLAAITDAVVAKLGSQYGGRDGYSAQECADRLDISKATVIRRINAKSIPTIPGIKPQRVPADYVARMMNQRQTNG